MKTRTIVLMASAGAAGFSTGLLAYFAVKKAKAELASTKAYIDMLNETLEKNPDAEIATGLDSETGEDIMTRVDTLVSDEKNLKTVNTVTIAKAALKPAIGLLATLVLGTVATAVLKIDLANASGDVWDESFEDIPQVDDAAESDSPNEE